MARIVPGKDVSATLNAATSWIDRSLIQDLSVFSQDILWTTECLTELHNAFTDNPLDGEGRFVDKLKKQISACSPEAKRLMAEMLWAARLFPSNVTARKKRQQFVELHNLSGVPLSPEHPLLSDPVLAGIGSAGPGYNNHFWREINFIIALAESLKGKDEEHRRQVFTSYDSFLSWIETVPRDGHRQFRHMMRYFAFPDIVERMSSSSERRAVVTGFRNPPPDDLGAWNDRQLDQGVLEIRREQENQYPGQALDFYQSPLRERWNKEDDDAEGIEAEGETEARQPDPEQSPIAAVASRITAADVGHALRDIDRDGVPPDARSARYDLIEEARRYPPKYVLELAAGYATGQRLDRASFTGGEESACFRILRNLGFHIEPKRVIQELVSKFLEQSKTEELSVAGYAETYCGLEVSVSFGKGNLARIPWIAFLAEGESVQRGIYPVLLLFREQGVLVLCYGVSETNSPARTWQGIGSRQTVDEWHRRRYARRPDRYGESYVKAAYDVSDIDLDDLALQLDAMIAEYQRVITGKASLSTSVPETVPQSLPVRADLPAAVTTFAAALRTARVTFGAAHEDLVRAILASLTTKPFLILTGMSGSGKTQVAVRLGQWLGAGRLHVAAVRPDWTGSEAVFGYEDALRPAVDGRSAWAVPGILEFMLKAARDPQHPYVLLLDEMNLAHVERYFADVLSGMESEQECLPNLVKESDGSWRVPTNARERLPFPKNLWVIGTVNVDETTYMFSPKVLDRANVFEFRVRTEDLLAEGGKPIDCAPGQQDLVRGLHAIALDRTYNAQLPDTLRDELAGRMRSLHRLLSEYGMEFGHRTFYESLRFAALMHVAGAVGVEHTLDRIVVQKVLPRLHGARRRLETPLLALAHFTRDLPSEMISAEKLVAVKPDQLEQDQVPRLPISYEKISRMLRSLRSNQFASFTE